MNFKYQTKSKLFTTTVQVYSSAPIMHTKGSKQGEKRFPNDCVTGVDILLSPLMEKRVHSFGSQGERICWVRLQVPVCNLFVISIYLPHRDRIAPTQGQIIVDLQKVLSSVPARDYMYCIYCTRRLQRAT